MSSIKYKYVFQISPTKDVQVNILGKQKVAIMSSDLVTHVIHVSYVRTLQVSLVYDILLILDYHALVEVTPEVPRGLWVVQYPRNDR